jgi:hypothetical protein
VLQQLLAGYRGWEAELEAFTKDASGAPVDPSFEQLASASHAARAWPITSPLRSLADDTFHKTGVCVGFISYTSLGAAPRLLSQPQAAQAVSLPVKLLLLPPRACCPSVDSVVAPPLLAGAWTERLRRALVKRSSGARVDSCMAYLQDSVDAAVQQFERRLDVSWGCAAALGAAAAAKTTRQPCPAGCQVLKQTPASIAWQSDLQQWIAFNPSLPQAFPTPFAARQTHLTSHIGTLDCRLRSGWLPRAAALPACAPRYLMWLISRSCTACASEPLGRTHAFRVSG